MIAVLGSGTWATEIVHLLMRQSSRRIFWWVRNPEKAVDLGEGRRRLTVSSDIRSVVEPCDDIIVAIPSAFLLDAAAPLTAADIEDKNIISVVKGFIPQERLTVTRVLRERWNIPESRLCVLSGPSHAEEVARGCLTYLTVATANRQLSEHVRDLFDSDVLCTVYSDDMQGVETAAALKNIYAIVAGIGFSLGYGDNLMAVMTSNAIAEMRNFLSIIHPDNKLELMNPRQLLPYVGDLLVTCYSQFSRNRTLGTMIGRGYSVKTAQLEMNMIAEGYYAVRSLEKIRTLLNLEMPVAQSVYLVLYENAKPDVLLRAWQIYKG